jgi:hypothetical protein
MKLLLFCLLSTAPACFAGVVNVGFETGDFTGWQTLGTTFNIAETCCGFGAVLPYSGQQMADIQTGGVSPSSVALFLNTTVADMNGTNDTGASATGGSAIKQSVVAALGEQFTFYWNFGTLGQPYDDWSLFSVNDGTSTALHFLSSVNATGNDAQTGWRALNYTAPVSGVYTFGFATLEAHTNTSTLLFVDGIDTGGQAPEPSSISLLAVALVAAGISRKGLRRLKITR